MEEPKTYTADTAAIVGKPFVCKRCGRKYPYPKAGNPPIRCECGWRYTMLSTGIIAEEFRPRIGQGMSSLHPRR